LASDSWLRSSNRFREALSQSETMSALAVGSLMVSLDEASPRAKSEHFNS